MKAPLPGALAARYGQSVANLSHLISSKSTKDMTDVILPLIEMYPIEIYPIGDPIVENNRIPYIGGLSN